MTSPRGLLLALDFMSMLRRTFAMAVFGLLGTCAIAGESCPMLDHLPIGNPEIRCSSHPCPPTYPRSALRAGLKGKVVLLVTVGRSGTVEAVAVAMPSQSSALNDAAVGSARSTLFPIYRPGRLGPQCYRVRYPIEFSRKSD